MRQLDKIEVYVRVNGGDVHLAWASSNYDDNDDDKAAATELSRMLYRVGPIRHGPLTAEIMSVIGQDVIAVARQLTLAR